MSYERGAETSSELSPETRARYGVTADYDTPCDQPKAHARIAMFGGSVASPLAPGVCEYGQQHTVIAPDMGDQE